MRNRASTLDVFFKFQQISAKIRKFQSLQSNPLLCAYYDYYGFCIQIGTEINDLGLKFSNLSEKNVFQMFFVVFS